MMSQNQGYTLEDRIPSIVKLNVGGKRFTTSLQTLARDPNSMLAAMFSGRHEVETTEDGSFFIDRDGTYFRFILNYLRNGELILPEGATFIEELEVEARFYQVQGILDELKVVRALKVFEKSVILTDRRDFRNVLIRWIPMEIILAGEWCLLFRASRDGFTASAFHSRCDNQGPTVTVVNSDGNIFGGFTESAWAAPTEYMHTNQWDTRNRRYLPCCRAFLFSLVNPSGLGPSKMSLLNGMEQFAIISYYDCGPVFGHDLYVLRQNGLHLGGSTLGETYQCPPGQQNKFFTGKRDFAITDVEVFGLHR